MPELADDRLIVETARFGPFAFQVGIGTGGKMRYRTVTTMTDAAPNRSGR
jgi:hypothetical protein